jgi:hypothetical protein
MPVRRLPRSFSRHPQPLIATTPSPATTMAIKQTLPEFEQDRNPIANSPNVVHSAI